MKRKKQFLIAIFCAFSMLGNSLAVFAQDKVKQQESKGPSHNVWVSESSQGPTFDFTLTEPAMGMMTKIAGPQVQFMHNEFSFDSKVVTGAPYSADAVTESIQTMADGNRIIRNTSAKIFRDSAGRTRREQALKAVGPWSVSGDSPVMISISDPVSGVHYNLNPTTRIANKMMVQRVSGSGGEGTVSFVTSGASSSATRVKVEGESGGDHIKWVTDDNRTVILSDESADKAVAELKLKGEMKARAGAVAGTFATPADAVFAFSSDAEVNKESLGTQVVEGVLAEGTRVTFTIAAGKIGNERPIVTVNERWYSPELQAVVMSKNSDPRMGETTYRLTNIIRSEPDPGLFQVPADYTVRESGFSFGRRPAAEALKKIEMERKARKPNEN